MNEQNSNWPPPSAQAVERFIEDLDTQISWEWKWENRNRSWWWGLQWTAWICRLALLAVAAFQVSLAAKTVPAAWSLIVVAILSMFNVALPLLEYTFKFSQRQVVHDRTARAYSVIRTQLRAGEISLPEAVQRFAALHEQPTEPEVRKLP